MAKNKIQFRKGMSLTQFFSKYSTDEKCRQILFDLRWPLGFVCPECGHTCYCQISSRKVYQCRRCHRQTSVTSGTIFDNTKLPLNIWFLAIYLITQSKNGISSLNLSRTIGVSANAALRMKHKLQHVMKYKMTQHPYPTSSKSTIPILAAKAEVEKEDAEHPGKHLLLPPFPLTKKVIPSKCVSAR